MAERREDRMMLDAKAFAAGLSPQARAWVAEQAQATGRPVAAVLETLAEEGYRAWRFPGISFKGDARSRRAWVTGTGLDVWEMIMLYRDFEGDIDAMVADYTFYEVHVRLALDYYAEYPEEIDQALAENRRAFEDIRERYPGLVLDA
jgi:uncharacterized protein (DUF433 family)